MAGAYNSGKWLKVRNWERFQHYKDRNPPWIKLHFALLSSPDWVMLDDASRVLAIASMLVASRHDGHVPKDTAFLQRVAYLKKPANFKPLIDCGFLEIPQADASDTLARASTMQADASTLQADARPETESEKNKKDSSGDQGFQKFWNCYPRHVAKKAAHKAYEKAVHETTPDNILAALEKQKPQWKDPKFIPHPATWLNRGQWDDETPTSQADWRDSLL